MYVPVLIFLSLNSHSRWEGFLQIECLEEEPEMKRSLVIVLVIIP